MKHLKTRIVAFALALVMVVSMAPAALAVDAPSGLEQTAQAQAEAAMEYGGATSVQYALWKDGEIVLTGSTGVYSLTENRLLTDDILYGVGSVSKVYTTAAMMRLVEDGKVELDAPVTTYLPNFTMADARYKDITVRMLLNHSSGLMGSAGPGSFLFADGAYDATDDLLERLSTQTLQAEPGAYSVYSNDSFSLAQLVIEAASGMDFGDFLAQEIAEPLGLTSTFVPSDDFDTSRLAKAYLTTGETRALPPETLAIAGCGGIYATASDLAVFGGALTGEGLLSEDSLAAMATNEAVKGMWPEDSEDDTLAYGLGWDNVHMFPFNQNGIQALVKGGDTLTYHAGLVVLPEYDMACAMLSSGGVSTYNQASAANILIAALAEEGVTVDSTAALDEAASADMPAELMDYSGAYGTSTTVGRVDVSADGVLTLDLAGTQQQFTYREDGTFRDESNFALLKFVEEENGQVYLFQKSYGYVPGWATFPTASYVLERLPDYEADPAALDAWQARDGKFYVQVNERYSSALYPFSSVFAGLSFQGLPEGAEGYLLNNQIVDANTAVPALQIPGTGSRDSGTVEFTEVDGVEYILLNGAIYMDSAAVPAISGADASYCTVQGQDAARWYQVGAAAGKTMSVTVPEDAMFAVYDASLQMVASSWIYGDTTVTLPEGGWIVFAAGDTARFAITMA